ncbi:hydroxymethylglutaryl-CoA reductase [Alteromonas sp. ASW11-36]|uniref:hydroxymethylglutaryl-CoA reductase (NADPH) n=1 Tax=Alteromonas arenosi TaxID=3055817 RepID=A0ABT7T0I8_9ALTE|nr:hydroxymethylglutaryl-CoA reductase [Alteromonas sp. ASW11-36]MDM7861329.1 hydroxymethylglutaryl-CoA reductase [Alteromonas sp. ASW11-36]
MFIPSILLKQLYTHGSLTKTDTGISFMLKNRLKDAKVNELHWISIDGEKVAEDKIKIQTGPNDVKTLQELNSGPDVAFDLKQTYTIFVEFAAEVSHEKRKIGISFKASPFGKLKFEVEDVVSAGDKKPSHIPRDPHDDYGEAMIKARQEYFAQRTGGAINHVGNYSVDPNSLKGNVEHFIGVAQVPIGIAGPLTIDGEYAKGDFVVPLATTEGTLVASYNRGMKLLNLSGGVRTTVVDDAMQRAPVFVFKDARGARDFAKWLDENIQTVRQEAEATSSVAKLTYIDTYLSNKFAFCRFNYQTGDAAGQNMVGRATFAACGWILDHYDGVENFYLESNFATDKKASQINIMRTRGKRITAEATIKREHLLNVMRVDPKQIDYHGRVAGIGSFLSGVNNTGLHSPNGITAMFIATGQDVANVSESSAGILYSELTDDGDLYLSLTIPSLIVATYGGGTGIGTQKECLELLDCYGRDRCKKFAEIVGAVALAGEISLASAISSQDWVSSHEQYGRNR